MLAVRLIRIIAAYVC